MFTMRLGRTVRAVALATSIALVPVAGSVVAAPAAHAEGGGKEWTGEGDGHLWSDDNNWSGKEAPKDGDSVTIHSPDSKGSTVHVVGVPDISLGDFSVTADGNATVSVSGGDVGVSGAFDWTSGTLEVNVDLAPLAHGSIGSGGKKYLYGDISAGIGSALTMSGVSGESALVMDDPHTITIGTGAALAMIGTNQVSGLTCCVNPAKIVNNGVIEMGPGSFELTTVEYDQTGRLDATFGPTMTIDRAPVKIGGGARFSGTGSFVMGQSTETTVANTIRIGGKYVVEQAGGTLQGNAKLVGGGQWHFTGGTLYGTLTNQPGNLFTVQGPAAKNLGNLTSTVRGNLVNHGVAELSGGTIDMGPGTRFRNESDGDLRLFPGVTVDGTSCCVSPALIENHGDLTVTAPATHDDDGQPVTVQHAGIYNDKNLAITKDQTLELASGPSQLSEPAVLGGGGTLSVGDQLVVTGALPVEAASTVRLHGGADVTGNGAVVGGPDATVQWDAGTLRGGVTFPSGTTVDATDAGRKYISAPSFGPTTVTTAGTTTVAAGPDTAHRTEITVGAGQRWVNSGALTVEGNTALDSSSCCVTPARLDNTGTITFAPAAGLTADVAGVEIHNQGTVNAVSGITAVRYPSYIAESGTTTVAAGATFGQTNFSSPLLLQGGTLTGEGTVTGGVVNSGGTVAPGASADPRVIGTLKLDQYTQGPGGHLTVDVGSVSRDLLQVGGAVKLAGVLTGVVKGSPAATSTVITGSTVSGGPDCTFTTGSTTQQFAAARSTSALALTTGAPAPTGCDVLTPLAPARIDGSGTAVTPAQDVLVPVAGLGGVPAAGVDAVALSVTVDGAAADGALSVGSGTAQALRYSAGRPASNATVARLDADGRLRLHVTSAATVHLDVTGWYGDAQRTTGGSLFHPLAPTAIRTANVTAGTDLDVPVAGKGGVPSSGATSVTVALELKSGPSAGALSVLPGGAAAGATVTQSYGANETVEALATVVPVNGRIRLHLSAGTANVVVRTLGYTTARSAGGGYLKLSGQRVDSFLADTAPTADGLAGLGGVSTLGADAYVLGVHASDPEQNGKALVGSWATDAPQTPAVALRAHVDASGAAVTTGRDDSIVRVATSKGRARIGLDLIGWYVG